MKAIVTVGEHSPTIIGPFVDHHEANKFASRLKARARQLGNLNVATHTHVSTITGVADAPNLETIINAV